MAIITLELTDVQMKQAMEEAEQQGLSVSELARLRLLCVALPAEPETDMTFEAATEYVFQKNSELYRRLA